MLAYDRVLAAGGPPGLPSEGKFVGQRLPRAERVRWAALSCDWRRAALWWQLFAAQRGCAQRVQPRLAPGVILEFFILAYAYELVRGPRYQV